MSKKIYKMVYFFMVISYVLSYTISFSNIGTYVRYLLMLLIITFLFNKKITIQRYYPILSLIIPFVLIPFLLIILGRYQYLVIEQLINCLSYIIMILVVIACSELFEDKKNFFKLTQLSIFFPIIFLLFRHFQDVTVNVVVLVSNIINDNRIDRSYLDFVNPNMLGLVLMLGLLCSLYFLLFEKEKRGINVLLCIFYMFLLLNTGSRTSLLAPVVGLIIYVYLATLRKVNKYLRIIFYITIAMFIVTIFYISLYDYGFNVSFFNTLTSGRIMRQLSSVIFLSNTNRLLFGIGNLNAGSLYSESLQLNNNLYTDNSPIFFIVTIGIAGLFFVIMTLIYIYIKIPTNALFYKSLFFCWIATSLFEHTLFLPFSLISIFFLISLQSINFNGERINCYKEDSV